VTASEARPGGGRLRGRRLFLSASVPSPERPQFYGGADAHRQIEDAVISLSRAVFAEGGTLVFGGHPAISPLVAMVAGEYLAPLGAEAAGRRERPAAPIEIYQSRAFEGFLPDETLMMFRLGYANLHWIDAVDGERFDPKAPRDQPPCPRSMEEMRRRMIGEMEPAAMVAIGGMQGIFDELRIFRELRRDASVYALATTGGAAALLIGRRDPGVRAIDLEVLGSLQGHEELRSREGHLPVVPYTLIVQVLVQELI
jgi:hypothetical protein